MLGVGLTASTEVYFRLPSQYSNRFVDVYFSDFFHFGLINEVKVGYTKNSAPNQSEVARDKYMVANPNAVSMRVSRGRHRYQWRKPSDDPCQLGLSYLIDGSFCPVDALINDILFSNRETPRLNIVYVYYDPQQERLFNRVYQRKSGRAQVAKALESNSCPYRELTNLGIPFSYKRVNCGENGV